MTGQTPLSSSRGGATNREGACSHGQQPQSTTSVHPSSPSRVLIKQSTWCWRRELKLSGTEARPALYNYILYVLKMSMPFTRNMPNAVIPGTPNYYCIPTHLTAPMHHVTINSFM